MSSYHWQASILHSPRWVNIPYRPHRIIIIGWGRLGKDGVFHPKQFCFRKMRLNFCCDARIAERARNAGTHAPSA